MTDGEGKGVYLVEAEGCVNINFGRIYDALMVNHERFGWYIKVY